MHVTVARTKDGLEFEGILTKFRPAQGYIEMACGCGTVHISLDDAEFIITKGDRSKYGIVADVDELQEARDFMHNARKFGWKCGEITVTIGWPVMEWEKK